MLALRRIAVLGGLVLAMSGVVAPRPVAGAPAEPASLPQVLQACPEPVDPVELTSLEQVESLLVGTWIRCDGRLLPITEPATAVGVEFAADGRFFRVYEEDGALIRVEGLEQEGTWELLDTSFGDPPQFSSQLNLATLGSGWNFAHPKFFGTPTSLMQTTQMPGESAAFVPWTGEPPIPGVPAGIGEGPCGLPTDPIVLDSVDEAERLLVGAWVRCSVTPAIPPLRASEVGIELAGDGRFFRLYDDGRGGLVRASGGEQEGTWTVADVGSERPENLQVNLTMGDSTRIGQSTLLQQPAHLRFDFGPSVDYQPWTGPPPVPGDPPPEPEPSVPPDEEPPQPAPPPVDELPSTGATGVGAVVALGVLTLGLALLRLSRRHASG